MKNALEKVALAATTEIVGAIFVGRFPRNEMQKLLTDPKAYLFSKLKLLIGENLDVSFVENVKNSVILVLPYYSCLNDINWEKVSDNLKQTASLAANEDPVANEVLSYAPRDEHGLQLAVS